MLKCSEPLNGNRILIAIFHKQSGFNHLLRLTGFNIKTKAVATKKQIMQEIQPGLYGLVRVLYDRWMGSVNSLKINAINIFEYNNFAVYLIIDAYLHAIDPPLTKLLYQLNGWGLFLLQTQYAKKPKNPV